MTIEETKIMNEAVVIYGFGQQGKRVAQKLLAIKQEGHAIELIAVFEPDPAKLEEDVLPGKKLRDLFPEAQVVQSTIQEAPFDLRGVTTIFDCSVTLRSGEDQHMANMEASFAKGFRKGAYATESGVYAVEKPASTSVRRLEEVVKKRPKGTIISVDLVESFMAVKRAAIDDIRRHSRRVVSITTARLSATQEKSVKGNRLILRDSGGALADKATHDDMHAGRVTFASHGEIRDARVTSAKFDILEIATPAVTDGLEIDNHVTRTIIQERLRRADRDESDGCSNDAPNASYHSGQAEESRRKALGDLYDKWVKMGRKINRPGKKIYIQRNGKFTSYEEMDDDARSSDYMNSNGGETAKWEELMGGLSEAYADVTWTASGVTIRHIASHLGAKPQDLEEIESWFTPALKLAVAEASTKRGQARTPEQVTAAYGKNFENLEARVARIECSDGTVYIEQTFAIGGGFFSARINPNQTVDILYEGAPNAPENDGMMNWVRNAFASRAGTEEPMFSIAEILNDSRIIHEADRKADRSGVWTLDLRDPQNEAFAKFLEEPLRKANCW